MKVDIVAPEAKLKLSEAADTVVVAPAKLKRTDEMVVEAVHFIVLPAA